MAALHARPWTEAEFLASRADWQRLLARSDADPLFMSWDWVSAWWRHHARPLAADLCVLGIHTATGEIVGIAPFYLHRSVHRGIFRARRLELLGNAWRDDDAVFSEYLDLIAPARERDAVCAATLAWLGANDSWDELVLCNLRPGSLAAQLAQGSADRAYLRPVESMTGWRITLPGSFETFAAGLSSNSRRKIVHQRDKLPGLVFESVSPQQQGSALERLERFVAGRWGSPVAGARQRFHAELVARAAQDGSLRLTELRAAGHCISVMLNLRAGDTEYYLQSGFDPSYARGLSPGYLHLGHAIEAACRDGMRHFDLLAGRGVHRDYKRDFAAVDAQLQSLHIVRKPALRALFRAGDRLRGRGTASHIARFGG